MPKILCERRRLARCTIGRHSADCGAAALSVPENLVFASERRAMHLMKSSFLEAEREGCPSVQIRGNPKKKLLEANPGVISEAFRILRPGGTFLLTEPVPSLGTDFAIAALRLVDRCTTRLRHDPSRPAEEEMAAIAPAELRNILERRPWAKIVVWRNASYHYASCTKSPRAVALPT